MDPPTCWKAAKGTSRRFPNQTISRPVLLCGDGGDCVRQLLLESIVLCHLGGVVGVAVGFGMRSSVTLLHEFPVSIRLHWAVRGLG